MTLTRTLVAAAICGVIAAAAGAQEAETGSAATDLPLGAPEGPQTYIAETHGDWEIRCIRVEEDQVEPCQLYQLLADADGNPVAEFNIFALPADGQVVAGATIVTPLDTMLTPQLRLRIDENEARVYPFAFCQRVGCFVRLGLTEGDIANMQNGSAGIVTIVPLPAPDQTVDLEVSLSGFTAGYEDLRSRMPEAQ